MVVPLQSRSRVGGMALRRLNLGASMLRHPPTKLPNLTHDENRASRLPGSLHRILSIQPRNSINPPPPRSPPLGPSESRRQSCSPARPSAPSGPSRPSAPSPSRPCPRGPTLPLLRPSPRLPSLALTEPTPALWYVVDRSNRMDRHALEAVNCIAARPLLKAGDTRLIDAASFHSTLPPSSPQASTLPPAPSQASVRSWRRMPSCPPSSPLLPSPPRTSLPSSLSSPSNLALARTPPSRTSSTPSPRTTVLASSVVSARSSVRSCRLPVVRSR